MLKKTIFILSAVTLAGCASLPEHSTQKSEPSATQQHPQKTESTSSGVKITPYDQKEIQRQHVPVIVPPQHRAPQKFDDGSQLPAFKTLMQKAQTAYKQRQLAEAERYALQAQRIAPQASETYLYLALIKNQHKQYANASALARRGLSYAQSNAMKKQLWLIVLRASEAQNQAAQVAEAKRALLAL